jgi:DNA invertase Pin-like site-specific DNA recombinase
LALAQRRAAARANLAAVTEQVRAAVLEELAAGQPEAAVARDAGVDRMTVRRWAGKPH